MQNENLSKALIEFQHLCPSITKDATVRVKTKTGGEYEFEYASFGNIVLTIKEALYKAKLAYTFPGAERILVNNDLKEYFICRVIHESGEYMDTKIEMPKQPDNMQERGSQLTYLKRYSLVLSLGLDTDSDDDANVADGNSVQNVEKKVYEPPQTKQGKDIEAFNKAAKKVTQAQINRFYMIQQKMGWSIEELHSLIRRDYGCEIKDLNMKQYDDACKYVQDNPQQKDQEEIPF